MNKKKIILITPRFKGYEIDIFNEFKKQHSNILLIRELPSRLQFLNFIWFQYLIFYFKLIKPSFLIVINGKSLSKKLLSKLNSFVNNQSLIYIWDSLLNYDFRNKLGVFDVSATFDIEDSKEIENLKYRPTFFTKIDSIPKKEKIIFGLYGGGFSYRYEFLRTIDFEFINEKGYQTKFLFYNPSKYFLCKFSKKYLKVIFLMQLISNKKYLNILKKSKIIIDIQSPTQSGYTMRLLDGLANNCVVITNNQFTHLFDNEAQKRIVIFDSKIERNHIEKALKISSLESNFKLDKYFSLSEFVNELLNYVKFG